MGNTGMYFVHLSDTHILAHEHERLYGTYTTANLRAVIEYIDTEQIKPSFVLITGDLAESSVSCLVIDSTIPLCSQERAE